MNEYYSWISGRRDAAPPPESDDLPIATLYKLATDPWLQPDNVFRCGLYLDSGPSICLGLLEATPQQKEGWIELKLTPIGQTERWFWAAISPFVEEWEFWLIFGELFGHMRAWQSLQEPGPKPR